MPNKKDVVNVDGQPTAKLHLLTSKKEAYLKFLDNPLYIHINTQLSKKVCHDTSRRLIPISSEYVYVSDVLIFPSKYGLLAISLFLTMGPMTLRSVYKESVCDYSTEFPKLKCIEGCPILSVPG